MLYTEIEKILNDHGYKVSDGLAYEYCCGVLEAVDWVHTITGKYVCVLVQPTLEYEKELLNLKDGEEYETDFSKLEVTGMFLESVFVNQAGFMDNSREGIILKDGLERHKILDHISGEDGMKSYYVHDFKYLEIAINAQIHPFEHERHILKCHMENLEKIEALYKPVLEKYDFFESYSSLFDVTTDNSSIRDNSDPSLVFEFRYPSICHKDIWFSTDCLDGRLKLNDGKELPEDFEKWLLNDYMMDKPLSKPLLEFRYIFDSEYLPKTSYYNIWNLLQTIDEYKKGYCDKEKIKKLSFEGVPMKDYQYLKDEVNEILQ